MYCALVVFLKVSDVCLCVGGKRYVLQEDNWSGSFLPPILKGTHCEFIMVHL